VLIKAGEISNAMTVSQFSEVAHHPTALWVSIHKNSYTHSLLLEKPEFSLAVLNRTQGHLALACGTVSGRDQNKCAALDLYLNNSDFLFLRGALASTSCRVRQTVDLEDHTMFVGDIIEADLESRTSHLRHLLLSDLEK
jgi:flavin reductase (DIM6/NTAB) family NADH-FMN oxidoreductase RutF